MRPIGVVMTSLSKRAANLVEQLKILRVTAELTGRELAELASWQVSKVSKIENGKQLPTENDVRKWAAIVKLPDDDLRQLLADVTAIRRAEVQRRAGVSTPKPPSDPVVASVNLIYELGSLKRLRRA